MFQRDFVANLVPSPSVKKVENLLIFGEVMGRVWCLVFDSQCRSEYVRNCELPLPVHFTI